MVLKILYASLMLTFLVVPFLYKSRRPSMLHFYEQMVTNKSWRIVYTRMIVLFLLAFHFYYLSLFQCQYELIPSSLICILLCNHSFAEKFLRFLQDKRVMCATTFFVLSCLFTPHFFPLGVTLGTILIGAVYYPSLESVEKRSEKISSEFCDSDDYDCDPDEGVEDVEAIAMFEAMQSRAIKHRKPLSRNNTSSL